MKKKIILAWTRDFTLAWAQWWSTYINPRVQEFFSAGYPYQLSYFNGQLLETYRLKAEYDAFITAVLKIDPQNEFYNQENFKRFYNIIQEIRELINKTKNVKLTDKLILNKLNTLSQEMYPWFTVSFALPQDESASRFIKKYPKHARKILGRLMESRKRSEGIIEELVEYWREVTKALLTVRKLPSKYSSFVLYSEIGKMLEDGNYIPDQRKLEERSKSYYFFKDLVKTGITRQGLFKKYEFDYASGKEAGANAVKGTVSSSGSSSIKASVSVILRNDEIQKFKKGSVLITVMTNPFFVPIMKEAAAVITDEGGITCHAAIVSRELKIPCITGTKIATEIFKDGDMVEVDANKGIVRKI